MRPNWTALQTVFRARAARLGIEISPDFEFRYDAVRIKFEGMRWIRYQTDFAGSVYALQRGVRPGEGAFWSIAEPAVWTQRNYQFLFQLRAVCLPRYKSGDEVGLKAISVELDQSFGFLAFSSGAFGFDEMGEKNTEVFAHCNLWRLVDLLSAKIGYADWSDVSQHKAMGTFRLSEPGHDVTLHHDLMTISIEYLFLKTNDYWQQVNERKST